MTDKEHDVSGDDGNSFNLAQWAVSVVVPAASGLIGVILGAWLTSRQQRAQRHHEFVARQLQDFYSPLLGIRSEIQMRSELRVRIHSTADEVWRHLCAEARDRGGPEELQRLRNERGPEIRKLIEYDNRDLQENLMPAYRQMVTVFRENYWLAEAETQTYFGTLLEFVDLWERWLDRAIASEVIESLGHSEESLHPFYNDLQSTHDRLRAILARGEA